MQTEHVQPRRSMTTWMRGLTAVSVATLAITADVRAQDAAGAAPPVAFVNVTVVPMDRERTQRGQTVIVRDGRIHTIGAAKSVRIPSNAQRVDGTGKFLMPGFTEMHGHLPNQAGPNAENVLALYTLAGVTTVRGMLGNPFQLELRKRVRSGELLGPTLILAGPAIAGQNTPSPAAGAQKVRDQKAAGFDLLKIQEGLSRETYDSITFTARTLKIPFAGHVPNDVGVKHALESGQATIEHLDNYVQSLGTPEFPGADEDAKLAAMVAATKRAGASVVPTMALWEVILGQHDTATLNRREELRYMPASVVAQWGTVVTNIRGQGDPAGNAPEIAKRAKLLRLMRDAQVPIIFGTDAPQLFSVPGFSIRHEMAAMSRAGLSNYEILRSGTRSAAEHFGATEEFGWIGVGKRADLVLLDGNPLESLANFSRQAGVMVRGRWLPKEEIDRRLGEMVGK